MNHFNFISLTFTFLSQFSVLLLLFITFWPILWVYEGFEKSQKSKMAMAAIFKSWRREFPLQVTSSLCTLEDSLP